MACLGGDSVGWPMPDASAPDASMLMDAQILEKVSSDTSIANYWDAAATSDVPSDISTGTDSYNQADTGSISTDMAISDAGKDTPADTLPADIDSPCGNCEKGYTCKNKKCVFAAQCDAKGLADLSAINIMMAGAFIKLQGMVTIAKPTCSNRECNKDNPCCQDCFASLKLGPITLKGDGISIGCLGTNCDFQDKCTSLTPGQSYIIWGELSVSGLEMELHVQGFCEAK